MFLRYNLLTILWAIIILVLVLLPSQNLPKIDEDSLIGFDKLIHISIFLVLVFLMIVGFIKQSIYPVLRYDAVKYALIISIGYSLVLEGGQFFSEGRTVDIYDIIANTVGCTSGFALFYVIYKL